MKQLRRLITILSVAALMAYPLIAWVGLEAWSPQIAAALLCLIIAPAVVSDLKNGNRSALRSLGVLPLSTLLLLILATVLNSKGLVLIVPTAMSAGLLAVFGSTLFKPPTIIERFALMVHELTPQERQWCRTWTWVWCGFFLFNGSVAALLTFYGADRWWRIYNGMMAYLLMGMLFGIEYTVRKYRFGRLKQHWLDQSLQMVFSLLGRQP